MKTFILFGSTGDLAKKYVLSALGMLLQKGIFDRLICVGRRDWDMQAFEEFLSPFPALLAKKEQISYVKIDIEQGDYTALKNEITNYELRITNGEQEQEITCHLCLSPEYFIPVAKGLAAIGFNGPTTRIMIEKPFGNDLKTAIELNLALQEYFPEEHIYRVDHFLGKNYVRELFEYRFSQNSHWSKEYISSIKILARESIQVEPGRISYYEKVGETRDKLQNHLLQILAISIMKLPTICADNNHPSRYDDEEIRDRIFQAISSITPFLIDPRHDIILGQYRGYKEIDGVAKNSQTPTYVRTHLVIDDPRWRGVDVELETGKALQKKESSVTILFRDGTQKVFAETEDNKNNAYEVLVEHAIKRDVSYFVRWDSIRAAWQVVNDLIHCTDNCPILKVYEKGSDSKNIK